MTTGDDRSRLHPRGRPRAANRPPGTIARRACRYGPRPHRGRAADAQRLHHRDRGAGPRSRARGRGVADAGRAAGAALRRAVLIGKTTTPEFGHKPFTEAPLFGRTANAWDQSRTSGGSSGGAAVAVAAGLG